MLTALATAAILGTPIGHPAPPPGDRWAEFHPFTLEHALSAGVCVALMFVAAVAGRAWRETPRERALRHAWGWMIVLVQGLALFWWFLPANFQFGASLPLHLCDLAVWAAAVAMLTERRWARTLLYFWGIGLSTQAFLTPTLDEGPGRPQFWLFWIGHTQIVGSAVYDVLVRGYRPRPRDLALACAVTLAYAAVTFVIDIAFGVNYGYVGQTSPDEPTIIDRLGPWPLRVVWMSLLVAAVYMALWAVWPLGERLRRGLLPPGASESGW